MSRSSLGLPMLERNLSNNDLLDSNDVSSTIKCGDLIGPKGDGSGLGVVCQLGQILAS